MAKVVLVWNEHPTEVVAGFHARKVTKILRDHYKHRVVLKRIPVAETNYGIVEQTANRLASLKNSFERARIASRRYGAPSFNFHSSDYRLFKGAEQNAPEAFKVGLHNGRKMNTEANYPNEIVIEHGGIGTEFHVVEIPSAIVALPKRTLARRKKALELAAESALNIKKQTHRLAAVAQLKEDYQVQYAPLTHPRNKYVFTHQTISEKIAAAIHERISRK